ncbi:MAG TPA: SGNH/GDSL hydrolase family protein [Candidatus Omnitrophota bacterium]|nr:SGNH/GDSL hydrolase family protein [Candidatus Omnitrophota bacterium]
MISGVICFGDSILAGTGASFRDKGCAKLLKARLKIPVSLKGINRNTSQDGLIRLQQDVLDQKNLSHVIILFGNNDCRFVDSNRFSVSQDHFIENLKEMAASIKRNHQIPMFCNLQPIDFPMLFQFMPEVQKIYSENKINPEELQGTYSDLIENFAKKSAEILIDIRTPLKCKKNEILAKDGLHPNDYGHEIIAQKIFAELKKYDSTI